MEANKHYVIHGSLSLDEAVTKEEHDALSDRVDELETGETDIETRVTNLEKIEILTGEITDFTVPANSTRDINITFDKAFKKAPKVFTQLQTYPSASSMWWVDIAVYIINITTTGCKLRVFNENNAAAGSGDVIIMWAAINDGN